ncbi:uncharacterized protein LOC115676773 isoform X2 [Syzygium oleosum]|uniref:uncharacterized protein LOC115676773 isoform X2 n=1 Tax=Syzygium oleosum TaxID=219896 RepID=UPI0024B8C36E|nr:uncharacterized protein LOC115676773 isoform X2 [Syzygium oleosum]
MAGLRSDLLHPVTRFAGPSGRNGVADHPPAVRFGPPPANRRPGSPAAPRLRAALVAGGEKPAVCTADELHRVPVSGSEWKLALWRYFPSPNAPRRNHPLLLLSGVGTNAIGYDLSPEASFARHMSSQGFDTWILEVRGAGLSARQMDYEEAKRSLNRVSDWTESGNKYRTPVLSASGLPSTSATDLFAAKASPSRMNGTFLKLIQNLSGQSSNIISQLRELSQKLVHIIGKGQNVVPPPLVGLQEHLSSTLEDFQKQLDVIENYDWDFDHYLEEDVPTAMDYIRTYSKSKDSKLLAIGHSMGGILLYAMLSRYGFKGKDPGLVSVATLGSSLDFTPSRSSLKWLLPLAKPAQALNVPVVPLGGLIAAAHPFASRPPFSWLHLQISAQDMMHPDLMEKLVMNNFGTVPARLLLQLTTAFQDGGLCDRSGTFFYKDHIDKCNVPILALAGDLDLICPPDAVYETAKLIPEHLLTYKVFGEPGGPHYAHYDLVGGGMAPSQVYPCIIQFLDRHDKI